MPEKRFAFRVSKELHRAAKIKAAMTDRTIADVCREALEKWVKEDSPEEQPKKP
jgi:predicted HicB family RNase H-like nuclease